MAKTKENLVCDHTEEHGGKYDWHCVRPPHGPEKSHDMRAFEKVAQKTSI